MLLRLSILTVLLCACCAGFALGAAPEPGDRAHDLAGYDIVSKQTVRLDDYFGRWVIVDFWASWCGPCVEELPNFVKQTRELRASGKLAVISVCGDDSRTLPGMRKLLREHRIDYPVLVDPAGPNGVIASEWEVDGWPSVFLIDPQGVVVRNGLRGESLGEILAYHISASEPRPLVAADSWHERNPDGSFTAYINVRSTARSPVSIHLHRMWEQWQSDPADPGRVVTETDDKYDWSIEQATLDFAEWGEQVYVFRLETLPEMNWIGYGARLELEEPQAPGGMISSGFMRYQIAHRGVEYRDGKWRTLEEADPAWVLKD